MEDARAARALNPEWSKPCYREGAALRLLQVFTFDSLIAPESRCLCSQTFMSTILMFCIWCTPVQKYAEAADAFYTGVKIDPHNKEMIEAFK